jgi:hypothetical protein
MVQTNQIINHQDLFYSNTDNHQQLLRGLSQGSRRIQQHVNDDNDIWLTTTRFAILLTVSILLVVLCTTYLIWVLIKSYHHKNNVQLKEKRTEHDSVDGPKIDNTEMNGNSENTEVQQQVQETTSSAENREAVTEQELTKRDTLKSDDIVVDNADFSEHSDDGQNVNIIFRVAGENHSEENTNKKKELSQIPRINSCKSDSSVESQVIDVLQQIVRTSSRSSKSDEVTVPLLNKNENNCFVYNNTLSTMLIGSSNSSRKIVDLNETLDSESVASFYVAKSSTNDEGTAPPNTKSNQNDNNTFVYNNTLSAMLIGSSNSNRNVIDLNESLEVESVASFHDVSERTPNVLASFLNDTLDIGTEDILDGTNVYQLEEQLSKNILDIPPSVCPTIVEQIIETDTSNSFQEQPSIDTHTYDRMINDASEMIVTINSTMNMSQFNNLSSCVSPFDVTVPIQNTTLAKSDVSPFDITVPIQNTTSAKKSYGRKGIEIETPPNTQNKQQHLTKLLQNEESSEMSSHSFNLFQLAQVNHTVLNTPTYTKE